MDLVALASAAVSLVSPLFGSLMSSAREAAAKEIGKKSGSAAWDAGSRVWSLLWDGLKDTKKAVEAAKGLDENPADPDLPAVLRIETRNLLASDPGFVEQLRAVIDAAKDAGVNISVEGTRNVVVARDVHGSSIWTGDRK